jgi:uroporphyrinogen-III synthase
LNSKNVEGRRLLIVRGEGGREKLKAELERRGARVDYVEVYRRRMPAVDADTIRKLWQDQRPDVIVITSVQSLENLLALTESAYRRSLLETPLAVMSPRIARHAGELGFTRPPCVAGGAGDAALTAAVIEAAAQIR